MKKAIKSLLFLFVLSTVLSSCVFADIYHDMSGMAPSKQGEDKPNLEPAFEESKCLAVKEIEENKNVIKIIKQTTTVCWKIDNNPFGGKYSNEFSGITSEAILSIIAKDGTDSPSIDMKCEFYTLTNTIDELKYEFGINSNFDTRFDPYEKKINIYNGDDLVGVVRYTIYDESITNEWLVQFFDENLITISADYESVK